jgi:putative two-component system response regulator
MFGDFSHKSNIEQLDNATRLAYISEIREWDNRAHLERIRKYCFILGEAIDLSYDENLAISLASILHDVGKVILPDQLIIRSANFTENEKQLSEHHTIAGAHLLESSTSQILLLGSTIALTHHERWDGSGYPNKLIGENIPLAGRICALADVFDALTTYTSYKPAVSPSDALNMLTSTSQPIFDPLLLKIMVINFNEIIKIYNSSSK